MYENYEYKRILAKFIHDKIYLVGSIIGSPLYPYG